MIAATAEVPKAATIIPAPREMRVTGGEYCAKKPPKMEKVEGIPPEGYELSIRRAAEYRRRLIGAHVNCAPLK